jgi:hypothetical protein
MDSQHSHVYIGRQECGCVAVVFVDDTVDKKWTASKVAGLIRRGYTPERMTTEAWRAGKWTFPGKCPHKPEQLAMEAK